jgi:hypothetical protein
MGFGCLTDARFIHLPNIRATTFPLASLHLGEKEIQMKKITLTAKLIGWVEYCWLLVSNPSFQAAQNKRLAFYQYQQSKGYNTPCY